MAFRAQSTADEGVLATALSNQRYLEFEFTTVAASVDLRGALATLNFLRDEYWADLYFAFFVSTVGFAEADMVGQTVRNGASTEQIVTVQFNESPGLALSSGQTVQIRSIACDC